MKFYQFLLLILSLICIAALGFIVFYFNPNKADVLTLIIFFIVLALAATGIITLIMYAIKIRIFKKIQLGLALKLSLRQSFLISLLGIAILIYNMINILNWWTISISFAIILLIELIFRKQR